MSVAEQQARRQRAQEAGFTFKKTTIAGAEAVYVFSPKGDRTDVYTVTFGGHHPRCCCMDYRKRCAGTTHRCKHIWGAEMWLGDLQVAEDTEMRPVEREVIEQRRRELWG